MADPYGGIGVKVVSVTVVLFVFDITATEKLLFFISANLAEAPYPLLSRFWIRFTKSVLRVPLVRLPFEKLATTSPSLVALKEFLNFIVIAPEVNRTRVCPVAEKFTPKDFANLVLLTFCTISSELILR